MKALEDTAAAGQSGSGSSAKADRPKTVFAALREEIFSPPSPS